MLFELAGSEVVKMLFCAATYIVLLTCMSVQAIGAVQDRRPLT